MNIVIIDYGAGNTKSVQFACNRLGYNPILSNSEDVIKAADKVIFPGVGQASHAMEMLKKSGLDTLIPTLKQPVLGICLGMQLLCNATEEGDTLGLGVFDVKVKRFSNKVKVPQMGWNTIFDLESDLFEGLKNDAYMYLVHSYYAEVCEHTIAQTNYDLNYSSALKKENFYGVQFHPEKSSTEGAQILRNFLKL
ncbi:glutamine amidotransferase [Gelidibacter algens]|uniref:Imidazole glycerol phosphate synthase subunit HisH n=1 Tax=Gelidibacter algens TaxID=49280 RepID=A0A1A7QZY7_9FLAO|nr:imidazole glycerol phosphate synthase subunit HisH [Gelidibacter algens]OBX24794.1 imidazole glycerol phosphate synthase, glutamine amidotransferase subunit [Gelidibacter algens]RAJ26776.1 glutamine amidotransferase [Gelidibacter algens]